jgi:hypothetical protein
MLTYADELCDRDMPHVGATYRAAYLYQITRGISISAYVSMRQHTSAYVSIRQHTSAYVSISISASRSSLIVCPLAHRSAGIRQHTYTSAYVSIRQHLYRCSAFLAHRMSASPFSRMPETLSLMLLRTETLNPKT